MALTAVQSAMGQFDKSLEMARKAVEPDPISISSLHNLGWTNLVAGHFQESIDAFDKALELHPSWIWGHVKKAISFSKNGRPKEAIATANKAIALMEDGWGSELLQAALTLMYNNCGDAERVKQSANRFLAYAEKGPVQDPFCLAAIYWTIGDVKNASEWMEKSIVEKSPGVYQYKH